MNQNQENVQQAARSIITSVVDLQVNLCQPSLVTVSGNILQTLNDIQRQARKLLVSSGPDKPLDNEDQVVAGYRQDVLDLLVNLSKALPEHRGDDVSEDQLPQLALVCETACGRIRNYLSVKQLREQIALRQQKMNGGTHGGETEPDQTQAD